MRNKLWIYGCSFSDCWIENKNAAWWKLLAQKLGLDYVNRSVAGFGWSFHQNLFYSDVELWCDDDIIIVENSFLTRMYSPFLLQKFEQFKYWPTTDSPKEKGDEERLETLLEITAPIKTIIEANYTSFFNSLKFLNKLKNKWFFWTVDSLDILQNYGIDKTPIFDYWYFGKITPQNTIYDLYPKNALIFENGIKYYSEWMRQNPTYCIDLNKGDIHQTQKCHEIQSNLFYNKIQNLLSI